MQSTLAILTILVSLISANSLPEEVVISDYVKSISELHRGPPVQHSNQSSNVKTRWIIQKLDNFNNKNTRTWKNRILINDKFNKKHGRPIFLYLGGEWKIKPDTITSGLWVDIAKEHNGSVVYTEHRFFGESIPTTPKLTESIKYQGVKQALADVANVIKVLKKEKKYKDSMVVVSGCSYSGTMAIWLKKLYPDLVVGSWASSPPLTAKMDVKGYMCYVGRAYRRLGGKKCYNMIKNATTYYQNLFANRQHAKAKELLKLCNKVENKKDEWAIFSTIANYFAGIAQYQRPKNKDLAKTCDRIRNYSKDDATAISKFLQVKTGKKACVDISYNRIVKLFKMQLISRSISSVSIGWLYLQCNQFGWFPTSSSTKQPFGSLFPVDFKIDICSDVFGDNYYTLIPENVNAINKEFGGKHIKVDNTYMTYGELDPWKGVGAYEKQDAVVIIPSLSHCCDRDSINASDSSELRTSKENLIKSVAKWLRR